MNLTKEYILEHVSDLDIIQRCVDIPSTKKRGNKYNNISSPFASDKNPSFSVYKKGNEWLFNDFSSGKGGDAFTLWREVQEARGKRMNFHEVLTDICQSFNIDIPTYRKDEPEPINKKHIWKPTYMQFTKAAVEYWQQVNVTVKTLDRYNVRQIQSLKYYSDNKGKVNDWNFGRCIAFEYKLGKLKKLYKPSQEVDGKIEQKSFMQRGENIGLEWCFGFAQLPNYKVSCIFITAGEKDCITLNGNGYYAVCFASENTMPSVAQMKALKRKCYNLFVLYDSDHAGEKASKRINSRYSLNDFYLNDFTNDNDVFDFFKRSNDAKDIFKQYLEKRLNEIREKKDISVHEHGGRYHNTKSNSWISNFTIETEAYIEGIDETPAKRVFTLVKNGRKSKAFQAPAEVFLSAEKFSNYVQNFVGGEYLFKGSTIELKEIQVLAAFELDETAKNAMLGQSDTNDNDFIFANGVLRDGRFIKPDRNNIAANYFLDDNLDNNFAFRNGSSWKLQDWFDSISFMYGHENTLPGLSMIIASLVYDNIASNKQTRILNMFPILSYVGQKGSGKSFLVKYLLSLFAYDYQPLEKATAKAVSAFMRHSINIPAFKDEVNRITDYEVDIFKAIANLTGRTTKTFSNDDRISERPPLRPLITAGQVLMNDEALLSRSIVCECEVLKKSSRFMKKSREFNTEKEKGFSNILVDLLSYREVIIQQYKKTYFDVIDTINYLLDEMQETDVNMRLVNNLCALFTPLLIAKRNGLQLDILPMLHKYKMPKAYIQDDFERILFGFIIEKLLEQKELEVNSDPVELFLQALPEMERKINGKQYIERGYDFDFDEAKDELYLTKNVFDKYIQYCADMKIHSFERAIDIKNYLKKKDYYVDYKNVRMRLLTKTKKCDVVKLSDILKFDVIFQDYDEDI